MKKILLILIFGMFFISFASAVGVMDTFTIHSYMTDEPNYAGGAFSPIFDLNISNFTVSTAGTPATRAYLMFYNGTVIENVSIVGGLATFAGNRTYKQNVIYYATVDNLGATYTKDYTVQNTYNITRTNIKIDGGCNGATTFPTTSDVLANIFTIGTDFAYITSSNSYEIVSLDSPANNAVTTTNSETFNASFSMSGTNYSYSWNNNTYYLWYYNGTFFTSDYIAGLSGNSTSTSDTINGFTVGTYYWNSYACYSNSTFGTCTWATSNNTFSMGSYPNSITYNNNTYETATEDFLANFSIISGSQVSIAQLIYNGTTYTISNTSTQGNNFFIEKSIDIPLNINGSANQTNSFYIKFTYNGSSMQTFGPYYQNSSFINLVKCNSIYKTQALNFTFYDEITQVNLNATGNNTDLYSTFKYWIGNGNIYKSYSLQNLSSTVNNYTFCIYPYASNITFKTDMDMDYDATNYEGNSYYLRNSTLTNVSSDILLYLIPVSSATKFFLTFQNGVNLVSNGIVNVQEYFVGLGQYKTVGILQTDSFGKATMYQQMDKLYRYSVIQNGDLLGVVDLVSSCSAAPCSLTILISAGIDSAFEAYNNYFAQNVLSNMSYDNASKTVTYSFIDITGLAYYFRLQVDKANINGGSTTVCNSYLYSSAGTLSCNVSGYEGDFVAGGFISRSPEKLDKLLSFIIESSVLQGLGINGIFIVLILIITVTIAAAVISKGNPTTVLFMLGISILGLKLINIFPFSWIIVSTLEVLIFWMIFKIKT